MISAGIMVVGGVEETSRKKPHEGRGGNGEVAGWKDGDAVEWAGGMSNDE